MMYQPPGEAMQVPAEIAAEPQPPQAKKQRGFRARLNQHIDGGNDKTDADLQQLQADRDAQLKQGLQDDENFDSEDEQDYEVTYMNTLLEAYKEDPSSLSQF